jgi:hypothetical protein
MNEYPEVAIQPGSTSYFSDPADALDPYLFDGDVMHEEIRLELLSYLMNHLNAFFIGPQAWVRAWVAGSGVSHQWAASRLPGDLDVLVGVDFPLFRQLNPNHAGSDEETAKTINEGFYTHLTPQTAEYRGLWETTWYVNPDSQDIRAINPYAAYDLVQNEWTVRPSREGAPKNKYWEEASKRDHSSATALINHYERALNSMRNSTNPAGRVNAEASLKNIMDQAVSLYDQLHDGRKTAFSRVGAGYADWGNYRWQAGKASGVVPALRSLKEYRDNVKASGEAETYGMELPTTDTLIRRAVARRTMGA